MKILVFILCFAARALNFAYLTGALFHGSATNHHGVGILVGRFQHKFQNKQSMSKRPILIAWFTCHHASSSCIMHHASCIMHHALCIMHHATSKQGRRLKFGMLTVLTNIRSTKVLMSHATLRFSSLAEQCHTKNFYLRWFNSDFDALKSKFGLLLE